MNSVQEIAQLPSESPGALSEAASSRRRTLILAGAALVLAAAVLLGWQVLQSRSRRAAYLQALRGVEMRDAGNRAGALAAFQRSTRLDPGNAYAWFLLGDLQAAVDPKEGLPALGRAAELAPGSPQFLREYGSALRRTGDYRGAQQALRRAVELAPDDAGAHALLGRAYLSASATPEDRAAAISAFQTALVLDPGDIQTRFRLAQLYYRNRAYPLARAQFHAILNLLVEGARQMQGRVMPGDQQAATWLSIAKGSHYHLAQIAFRENRPELEQRHRRLFDSLAAYIQESYTKFAGPSAIKNGDERLRAEKELYRRYGLPEGGVDGATLARRWIPENRGQDR